ncbi:MAG: helix-turn-helix domain-containing protein [Dehalobacterium sp.]|jgi:arginine utilization regulatory protein
MNLVEEHEETLHTHHLPSYFREILLKVKGNRSVETAYTGTLHHILASVEKEVIEEGLRRNKGNITKTAEELGVYRESLYYRIKKLEIKRHRR